MPIFLILVILLFCSYGLAKIGNWVVGLLGSILLWLLLVGITVSIYPRMDYVTTSILVGGIGVFIWITVQHRPTPVKEWYAQLWIHKQSEVSMGIELRMLPLFLKRIIPLVECGFTDLEVEFLRQNAAKLTVDDEIDFEFQVQYRDHATPFHVKVFMDDIEEVGLYFFTAKGLAAKINQEMLLFHLAVEIAESFEPNY